MFPRQVIVEENGAKANAAAADSRFYGADGRIGDHGNFSVVVAHHVREHDGDLLIDWKNCNRFFKSFRQLAFLCFPLRNFRRAQGGPTWLLLSYLLVKRACRLTGALPDKIETAICGDAQQPRTGVFSLK